jgi:hypothetical protein
MSSELRPAFRSTVFPAARCRCAVYVRLLTVRVIDNAGALGGDRFRPLPVELEPSERRPAQIPSPV